MTEDIKPQPQSAGFVAETNAQAKVTQDWFASNKPRYTVRSGIAITPLINGAEIFPAIEKAITNAQKSVDIICYGFDPALKLSGYQGTETIGDLLISKAKSNPELQIRVLIWSGMWPIEWQADTVKDVDQKRSALAILNKGASKTAYKKRVRTGIERNNPTKNIEAVYDAAYDPFLTDPYEVAEDNAAIKRFYEAGANSKNLQFKTRDTTGKETSPAIREPKSIPYFKKAALKSTASHHQKMVLIDYEDQSTAIGFIMGHNFHKNYYDDGSHSFFSPDRWPGFRPYQDVSSRVYGPILYDLNDNFSKAWDKVSNDSLYAERASIQPNDFSISEGQSKELFYSSEAQFIRTEPSYRESSIREVYVKALKAATNYIYMENQYFRYAIFVDLIKQQAPARRKRGSKILHLFVITNPPSGASAINSTADMLERLGNLDHLPKINRSVESKFLKLKKEREVFVKSLNSPQFKNNTSWQKTFQNKIDDIDRYFERLSKKFPTTGTRIDELSKKQGAIDQRIESNKGKPKGVEDTENASEAFTVDDVPGLKSHVATLMTNDVFNINGEPKSYYTAIYVHSKLMLVDDIFTTLGSANINQRSMESDTETGISAPCPALTKHCREKLFKMHTKKNKETAQGNYKVWQEIMDENWKNMHHKRPLKSSLTHLYVPDATSTTFTTD